MSNSDADKKFDAWLSSGLKKTVGKYPDFAERLLARLDERQGTELLTRVRREEKIYTALTAGLILAGVGVLLIPPVWKGLFTFLQAFFVNLVEFCLEPTLTGLIIPAGIILAVAAVLWNLIEMVALE